MEFIMSRVLKKGVDCPPGCSFCSHHCENEWHLFFECHRARQTWIAANLWHLIQNHVLQAEGNNKLIFELLQHLPQHILPKFSIIMCSFWKQPNEKVWNSTDCTPSISVTLAVQQHYAWLLARHPLWYLHIDPTASSSPLHLDQWTPPPSGFIKCNLVAAIFNENQAFGTSFCIRDDEWKYIKSRTSFHSGIPNPLEA